MSRDWGLLRAVTFAALVAASPAVPALAYTETPAAPAPQAPATGANLNGIPGLSIQDPSAAEGLKSGSGTELAIPGIGTIGTLPKLDLGLELLYGGPAEATPTIEAPSKDDEVQIKGTLKHKF